MDQFDQETGEVAERQAVTTYTPTQILQSDPQVALALARPRAEPAVIADRITKLATMDDESAAECLYALVRGQTRKARNGENDESNKPIEGPSIRLAEIAAQMYGNCRIEARVVDVNRAEKYVEAEGTFIDLETNMGSRARVRRRISTRNGGLFSEDMIIVTGNAACAIAKRNAILAGIPRPLYRPAYAAARKKVAGDAQSIPERWSGAVKAFASYGVKPEQMFALIGAETIDQVTPDDMARLIAVFQSIKSSEVTVEEAFAPEKKDADPNYDPLKDAKAKADGKAPEGEKPAKPTDDELDKIFAEGKAAKAAGAEEKAPYSDQERTDVWMNGYHAD